jgi:hypothetical protein
MSGLSAAQFGGPNNGVSPGTAPAQIPASINVPTEQRQSSEGGVVGLQSKNQTTYGRTTAWRVPNGATPAPYSKNTSGSYLNFE